MPTDRLISALLVLFSAAACNPSDEADAGAAADDSPAVETAQERPAERLDTLLLEGMPEPIMLRLYSTPEDVMPGFGAYVPADMVVEEGELEEDGGWSVHFQAAFGGRRNPDAFVHFYVYPDSMSREGASGAVLGYKTGRGVPVSTGIEPLPEPEAGRRMPWALESYTFRYQSGGQWYLGSIGLGRQAGRFFHIITHYPAEYGDGFGPRAALLLETWRWRDGTRLVASGP